jgi:hypothetical protein
MITEYGREVLPWGSGRVQFVKNDETFNQGRFTIKASRMK